MQGCANRLDIEAILSLGGLPDAEELRLICPGTKGFLQCLRNFPSECNMEDTFAAGIKVSDVEHVLGMVDHICDEDSDAHRKYIEHAPCISKIWNTQGRKCILGGTKIRNDFLNHRKELEGVLDEKTARIEGDCIEAYAMTECLLRKTVQTCGLEATGLVSAVFTELEIIEEVCSADGSLEKINIFFQGIPDVQEYFEANFAKRK